MDRQLLAALPAPKSQVFAGNVFRLGLSKACSAAGLTPECEHVRVSGPVVRDVSAPNGMVKRDSILTAGGLFKGEGTPNG
mmetsp:Transcript_131825/g.422022  ORF Transcript_131825/g.422022 Transcript_131825/m.422022 type:complete len:80 (-) Transcript_131825:125-364(-)